MIRTPIALVPYLVLVAVLIGGVLWQRGNELSSGQITTGEALIGGPFALEDQTGTLRTDKDFRGKYLLIYFGYTFCPDVCPLSLGVMDDALRKLPKDKTNAIVPVFITVDPERDTSKVLKDYLAGFGPGWVGLTGNLTETEIVAKEYRVYFAKAPLKDGGYAVNHSSTIYLMGPDGRYIANFDESIGPDQLAAELKKRV
ncbi:MAG TPA: SCO family protein [Rhizomicrobium sp.]|jgi:protein SCO1/2|nr:SCO family protein [Rhizomicrobium sp.]